MEKSLTSIFMDLPLAGIVKGTLNACREAAEEIPVFKETRNGCYVTMYVPLCPEADVWLGGMSVCDGKGKFLDVHEYVSANTVLPGGSHTIQWKDPTDGHTEPVNCYAYATMKIAYLSRLVKEGISCCESDLKANEYLDANGYAKHKGAVCTTVYRRCQPLFRVYDAVSGATQDEDLACAMKIANKRMELIVRHVPGQDINAFGRYVGGGFGFGDLRSEEYLTE